MGIVDIFENFYIFNKYLMINLSLEMLKILNHNAIN